MQTCNIICKDTWLMVGPAWPSLWMQMCDSVQSLSLLSAASICLCANVSWFLGISGPGGHSDSEFELTVCHCHNIKATIRHTDTSVCSSSSSCSRSDTCEYSCSCSPALTCQCCQWLFFSLIAFGEEEQRWDGGTPQPSALTACRSKSTMGADHVAFNISN